MQNLNRLGRTLTYANPAGGDPIKGGDLVLVGDVVGVAAKDIVPGSKGALVMEGVFWLPKDAAAIAVGQRVYVDVGAITATAGGSPAGVAWAPAAAADTQALVKINV